MGHKANQWVGLWRSYFITLRSLHFHRYFRKTGGPEWPPSRIIEDEETALRVGCARRFADGVDQNGRAAVFVEPEQSRGGGVAFDRQGSVFNGIHRGNLGPNGLERGLERIEQRSENEIGRGIGPDFLFGRRIRGLEILGQLGRPLRQIGGGQARRPSAPIERTPADAIGQAGESHCAAPGNSPNFIAGHAGIIRRGDRRGGIEPDARQILDVFRHQEFTRFQDQHAKIGLLPKPVNLLSAVGSVHAGTDHDGVKRRAAIIHRFVPGIADVAPENVAPKARLLHQNRIRRFDESLDHQMPPCSYSEVFPVIGFTIVSLLFG